MIQDNELMNGGAYRRVVDIIRDSMPVEDFENCPTFEVWFPGEGIHRADTEPTTLSLHLEQAEVMKDPKNAAFWSSVKATYDEFKGYGKLEQSSLFLSVRPKHKRYVLIGPKNRRCSLDIDGATVHSFRQSAQRLFKDASAEYREGQDGISIGQWWEYKPRTEAAMTAFAEMAPKEQEKHAAQETRKGRNLPQFLVTPDTDEEQFQVILNKLSYYDLAVNPHPASAHPGEFVFLQPVVIC
jgi:hypothetical protein